MRKVLSVVVALSLLFFMFALEVQGATTAVPSISVEVKGANEIVVNWENVTQEIIGSPSVSVQIRQSVDPGNLAALAYHYVYNTTENNGASGSVTFSDQYAGSENRKENFPLADGTYYAILRLDNGSLLQETRFDFTVGTPPAPPELSVTVNNANEIVVNWKNVSKETIGSPSASVQIRSASDTGTMAALAYHYVYNTTENNGAEGSVTFSDQYAGSEDRKANFPLADGDYYAVLRMDNGGLLQDYRADFTVATTPSPTPSQPTETPASPTPTAPAPAGTPKITVEVVSKGEVKVKWENFTKDVLGSNTTWASIQIRPIDQKGEDTCTGESSAWLYIYKDGVLDANGEYTFTTGGRLADGTAYLFDDELAAGEYFAVIRTGAGTNYLMDYTTEFTVRENQTQTGDVSLMMVGLLLVASAAACVIIRRKVQA